jgi:hypothetical protein
VVHIVVEVPAVACFPGVACFHAVAGFHAVTGIPTVTSVFLCSVSAVADVQIVHAVAGIPEDVCIPFVTDIPAVDGFSTIVSIVSSPLPTFRYCCCFCCCLRACSWPTFRYSVVSAVAFVPALGRLSVILLFLLLPSCLLL